MCGRAPVPEAGSWPVSVQVCVFGLKVDEADVCICVCVAVNDWLSLTSPWPDIFAE